MFNFIRIALLVIAANSAFSQTGKDTIVLLNGNTIVTTIIDTTGGSVSFKNPKHPQKNIVIENNRIFSINSANGETILYVYDTTIGNEFTPDEMRYFILGEQDARKGFKPRGALIGSFSLSAGIGLIGNVLSPIVPFAYSILSGAPKVKIKKSTVSNLDYLKQDAYIMGYERVARGKRKIQSLISGGVGLVMGLTTYYILKNNNAELIK